MEDTWTKVFGGKVAFFYQTIKSTVMWKNKQLRWMINPNPAISTYSDTDTDAEIPSSSSSSSSNPHQLQQQKTHQEQEQENKNEDHQQQTQQSEASLDWESANIYLITICNGQYQGGGMRVGPQADLFDGLFDIVAFRDCSLWNVNILTETYAGTHASGQFPDKVSLYRGSEVFIEPLPDVKSDVYVELDGELPGKLPASWHVLPEAIRLIIPDPNDNGPTTTTTTTTTTQTNTSSNTKN